MLLGVEYLWAAGIVDYACCLRCQKLFPDLATTREEKNHRSPKYLTHMVLGRDGVILCLLQQKAIPPLRAKAAISAWHNATPRDIPYPLSLPSHMHVGPLPPCFCDARALTPGALSYLSLS